MSSRFFCAWGYDYQIISRNASHAFVGFLESVVGDETGTTSFLKGEGSACRRELAYGETTSRKTGLDIVMQFRYPTPAPRRLLTRQTPHIPTLQHTYPPPSKGETSKRSLHLRNIQPNMRLHTQILLPRRPNLPLNILLQIRHLLLRLLDAHPPPLHLPPPTPPLLRQRAMHPPQLLHLRRRRRRLPPTCAPQRLRPLRPPLQLPPQQRLRPLHFAHVVAPLRQRVAVARRAVRFVVFARELPRYVGEEFAAGVDVGGDGGEGVARGVQGARAALEGVDAAFVAAQGVGEVGEGGLQRGGGLGDVRAEFLGVVAEVEGAFGLVLEGAGEAGFVGADGLEALDDFLLALFELEEALLEVFIAVALVLDLGLEGLAGAAGLVEVVLHVRVFGVEGLDAGLGAFGFVEVLVDGGGLGLAEADEIDDVGEDFDEALVRGFEEVGEGEVVDAALVALVYGLRVVGF